MHGNSYIVIAGSTRPTRRSPAIADWVASLGREASGAEFRVVDLLALGLTLDDEPGIPAAGGAYASAATRAWSEQVAAARGVVIVTPQYNWGYPAALKNAIDHLYTEWRGKPVLIVTYGGHGGGKCGRQLRQVLGGMGVRHAAAPVGMSLARARIEANDGLVDPPAEFGAQAARLKRSLARLAAMSPA